MAYVLACGLFCSILVACAERCKYLATLSKQCAPLTVRPEQEFNGARRVNAVMTRGYRTRWHG
jgi:hypothetical protein